MTNVLSTVDDNKYNCNIESKIDEKSILLGSMISNWDIEDNVTHLNQQILILQELEQDELISMAIKDSLLSWGTKTQLKLEEEKKGKDQNVDECDLTLPKINDGASRTNQADTHDNNNNDKLNISDTNLKINDIQSDTALGKGADKVNQINDISLNQKTDTSLNLRNSNKISVSNENAALPIPSSTFNSNNESKEESKYEVKQSLGKKEMPKEISKDTAPISILNKKNNVIVRQSNENNMKYGIKQSIKNLSTHTVTKTLNKRNYEPNQSMLNTSKVLKNKCNVQPKKVAMIIKQSPEFNARHNAKNLKGSEQNKTISLNTANKQYKVNHICYVSKKEENGSMPKTTQHTVHTEITNYSNLAQPTSKQSLETTKLLTTHKKILKTSDKVNKCKDIKQKATLRNDGVTETLTSIEDCDNRSNIINKTFINVMHKEINTSSNEVKDNNGSSMRNLANKYSQPKRINTNPFLEDFSNSSTSNNSYTDTKDFKGITDSDLNIKSTELGNIPSTNVLYAYHVSQQNAQQEQIPSHQNYIPYIPDQFIMDRSVNMALPKFHPNALYSNANKMQLGQYENTQAISNVSSVAQVQNYSNTNILSPNMDILQCQMANVLLNSSENVKRPTSNLCIHPMPQEEQYNLPANELSPAYFMNSICICRDNCFLSHLPHWNLPLNYSVPLQQSPYYVNYNSFCNPHMQSNNVIDKNVVGSRPLKSSMQVQIPYGWNSQRNYEKPMSNPGCNIRNPKNNKIYEYANLNVHMSSINTRESIDSKRETLDGEFLYDKGNNNLPMISPKACMIYGSELSKNFDTTKLQMKYSGTADSVSNFHFQYQKNNECHYTFKEYLPTRARMGCEKTKPTQLPNKSSYKAQY